VLRFGEFKTKAGRQSPYFFNAGLFDDGAKLGRLAQFYARACWPRASSSTCCSARPTRASAGRGGGRRAGAPGRNVPFAYNRKEAKDHGEGGTLVGARCRAGC
jgi:orotate phosphoribosyltransferase